jgi:glycosyltransferase involved in cell wall biosynthesis
MVASNSTLWKKIVENGNCRICADPLDPKEIANAINYLLSNDDMARIMGENGRKLIETKYNWENEEKKLINFV